MTMPTFDKDGYPSDATLQVIRDWPFADIAGWLAFCRECWRYPDYWEQTDTEDSIEVEMHTGGWSGNEDVVEAMMGGFIWPMVWEESRRGGHYRLDVPRRLLHLKASQP